MTGTLVAKLEKSGMTRGYLILTVAPNSIHLNPDYHIAQWSIVGIA